MAHEGLGRLIQAAEWREIRGNEKEGPICFRRPLGMEMVDSGTGVGYSVSIVSVGWEP